MRSGTSGWPVNGSAAAARRVCGVGYRSTGRAKVRSRGSARQHWTGPCRPRLGGATAAAAAQHRAAARQGMGSAGHPPARPGGFVGGGGRQGRCAVQSESVRRREGTAPPHQVQCRSEPCEARRPRPVPATTPVAAGAQRPAGSRSPVAPRRTFGPYQIAAIKRRVVSPSPGVPMIAVAVIVALLVLLIGWASVLQRRRGGTRG